MFPPGFECPCGAWYAIHTTNILPTQDPMFVPPRGARRTGGRGWRVPGVPGGEPADRPAELLATAMAGLADPGLVVLAGGPGAGRSTPLRRLGEAFPGPVFARGGPAQPRGGPAVALGRARKGPPPAPA